MAMNDTEKLNKIREQNRVRQANYRKRKAKLSAERQQQAQPAPQTQNEPSTLRKVAARYNELISNYGSLLGVQGLYGAFGRAAGSYADYPQVQNQRVKSISSLPAEYTKDDIGEFLQNPYASERPLRQTAQTLRWTAYPFFKIIKSYQDIATYRYYAKPLYLKGEEAQTKEFWREAELVDKFNKEISPETIAHKIAGQCGTAGKVFYLLRYSLDKSHNKVNYAFLQQLPQDWCEIIGYNNISGYTVSFDLMYFLQIGTDYTQFGDLFAPYMDDFNSIFEEPKSGGSVGKVVYCSGKAITYYPNKIKRNAEGQPRAFEQNGRFMYYVSLPVEKVWTFEIDDATSAVASPFAGLLLTYAQQSDFENAQLSLILNPLIKIFTGEVPTRNPDVAQQDDCTLISMGAIAMYQQMFADLMTENNTGGTAFFGAPFENIKSHDFSESANANDISSSFNRYGMEKAGLSGLIPVESDVKAGQAELSAKLESRFVEPIYRQFEKMMNYAYKAAGLKYSWGFRMFGSIYKEADARKNAETDLANGDYSAYFILAALDGQSVFDKLSMMKAVKSSGMLEILLPPPTSYTQTGDSEVGRPKNEEVTEGNEKSVDSGEVD